jgi:hypothetical protein
LVVKGDERATDSKPSGFSPRRVELDRALPLAIQPMRRAGCLARRVVSLFGDNALGLSRPRSLAVGRGPARQRLRSREDIQAAATVLRFRIKILREEAMNPGSALSRAVPHRSAG